MLAAQADAVTEERRRGQDFFAGAAFFAFSSSHSFSEATITQPFPLHAFRVWHVCAPGTPHSLFPLQAFPPMHLNDFFSAFGASPIGILSAALAQLAENIPADAHVTLTDVTSSYAVLALMGPRSRDILASGNDVRPGRP